MLLYLHYDTAAHTHTHTHCTSVAQNLYLLHSVHLHYYLLYPKGLLLSAVGVVQVLKQVCNHQLPKDLLVLHNLPIQQKMFNSVRSMHLHSSCCLTWKALSIWWHLRSGILVQQGQGILFIMSLFTAAVTKATTHWKPASARHLQPLFPLQFNPPYFREVS